mmetsp:Transcript_53349/g.133930  ORF Transcript_53349/g.133930 Transcript_53349/m.133930 type:complete len:325 (+) Transcript_53349:24-998(+)
MHSTKQKLVVVSPGKLTFPLLSPSDRVSTEILRVTSKSNEVVTFKVRTTNPERYVVRPNIGIIAPGEAAVIQVILSHHLPVNADTVDMFQVLCLPLPSNRASDSDQDFDIDRVWASPDADSSTLSRTIIKAKFSSMPLPSVSPIAPSGVMSPVIRLPTETTSPNAPTSTASTIGSSSVQSTHSDDRRGNDTDSPIQGSLLDQWSGQARYTGHSGLKSSQSPPPTLHWEKNHASSPLRMGQTDSSLLSTPDSRHTQTRQYMIRIEELEEQVRSLQQQLDKQAAETLFPRSIPRSMSHSSQATFSRSNIIFALLFALLGYILSFYL